MKLHELYGKGKLKDIEDKHWKGFIVNNKKHEDAWKKGDRLYANIHKKAAQNSADKVERAVQLQRRAKKKLKEALELNELTGKGSLGNIENYHNYRSALSSQRKNKFAKDGDHQSAYLLSKVEKDEKNKANRAFKLKGHLRKRKSVNEALEEQRSVPDTGPGRYNYYTKDDKNGKNRKWMRFKTKDHITKIDDPNFYDGDENDGKDKVFYKSDKGRIDAERKMKKYYKKDGKANPMVSGTGWQHYGSTKAKKTPPMKYPGWQYDGNTTKSKEKNKTGLVSKLKNRFKWKKK